MHALLNDESYAAFSLCCRSLLSALFSGQRSAMLFFENDNSGNLQEERNVF